MLGWIPNSKSQLRSSRVRIPLQGHWTSKLMLFPLLLLMLMRIIPHRVWFIFQNAKYLICHPRAHTKLMLVSLSYWDLYHHLMKESVLYWCFSCFSKTRKKWWLLFFPVQAVSAIVRTSSKSCCEFLHKLSLYHITSWLLAFDTQNSIVRKSGHISFLRNWGTNKSLDKRHQVSKFVWKDRCSNFESSVLLHFAGFRQMLP